MHDLEPGLARQLENAGQETLLRHLAQVGPGERRSLVEQLRAIDLDLVAHLIREHVTEARPAAAPAARRLEPAPILPPPGSDPAGEARARRAGEDLLRAGRVGLFLVAGGQGSRLGFEGPKGLFPAGPVTGKPLFQLFAERIAALRRRYGAPLPWFVMTSAANHEATGAYFEAEGWFGLGRDTVHLVCQGMLPAVDLQGRLMLEERGRLFLSPDGHGGALRALSVSGGLEELRRRGVEHLFYFQVDNPLAPIADPLFLGHHALARSEMSTKVVEKRHPAERLGVLGRVDGRLTVIEYSDLPKELAAERDDEGRLRFRAGNIAIHAFSRAFLERRAAGGPLPFHRAIKRMAALDPDRPDAPRADVQGIKFESFIFDILGDARAALTQEVRREEEFSPIKNKEGEDSPATARRDLMNLFGRWLEAAGVAVPRDEAGNVGAELEIDPLYALDAEELRRRLPPGLRAGRRLHLKA